MRTTTCAAVSRFEVRGTSGPGRQSSLLGPSPLAPRPSPLLKAVLALLAAAGGLRAADIRTRPALITPETEQAIQKGLAYLARTQSRAGSWYAKSQYTGYPSAMTALAGLALMAAGNTPTEGEYAVNVRRAVDYCLSCANRNGLIARIGEEGSRPMYGHGFSMLFLAQAYGMEQDPDLQRRIRRVLGRAVRLTSRSQSRDGGWLYTPDANGDEGSVTVTQIQALRAARNAGIKVPKSTINRAVQYIAKCANADGGISYSLRNRGSSRPAITAAAVATLYNAGEYDNPVALKALDYIKKHIQDGKSSRLWAGHAYYTTLYASQAMYLSGEENWRGFFPERRDHLVEQQKPDGSWMGDHVGDTYGTAIALLVLQLPYRYLPILQR